MKSATDRERPHPDAGRTASARAQWVPPGQTITIGSLTVPGGMIYVGTELQAIRNWGGPDPALIDPRLPADDVHPDRACSTMTYWPSYSDITPAGRGGYLAWLSGGRRDPDVGIGHVFLFFYGLERRLLHDGIAFVGGPERDAILIELERLLALYGRSGSFRGYASRLLGIAHASLGLSNDVSAEPPADLLNAQAESTLPVRLALGKLALAGRPVSAGWALAWVLVSQDINLRTPATRCAAEFAELFRARYRKLYTDGLVIRPNKTPLRLTYTPASASFGGEVSIPLSPEVPDVGTQRAAVGKLQGLAEECTEALESYSRWQGRNPDTGDSLPGLALLPSELLAGRRSGIIGQLTSWLSLRLCDKATAVAEACDLIHFWTQSPPSKLAKADAVAIALLCEKLGYAFEPDVRFGGSPLASDGKVVLFRIDGKADAAPSAAYRGATVMLHLAAAVAAADGTVAPEETGFLADHMQQALQLNPGERTRLDAHLRWLLEMRPNLTGLRKRLEALPEESRRPFADFVIGVAGADGRIAPDEINVLRKIFPLLGLDPEEVYGRIHAMTSGAEPPPPPAEGPVTVRSAAAAASGYRIPERTDPKAAIVLDMRRVQAKLNETAAVAALLGDVFTEDDEASSPHAPPGAAVVLPAGALDATHVGLLARLASQPSWSRAQLEAVAAELGLMPDGALEAINDAAFEKVGCAVCEGDDPIEINQDAYREFMA
ncbi:MAG: tellurite resistance TerB family protein [Candidatus Krumholzibacteriia bacterium]